MLRLSLCAAKVRTADHRRGPHVEVQWCIGAKNARSLMCGGKAVVRKESGVLTCKCSGAASGAASAVVTAVSILRNVGRLTTDYACMHAIACRLRTCKAAAAWVLHAGRWVAGMHAC